MKKVPRALIILGSESDDAQVAPIYKSFQATELELLVIVASCHRDAAKVRKLAKSGKLLDFDFVIYCGGKAFAAAGVLDAWCHHFAVKHHRPATRIIGVALGSQGTDSLPLNLSLYDVLNDPKLKALLAAILSIEELPSQPVGLKKDRSAFVGPKGLREVLEKIIDDEGEFSEPTVRKGRTYKELYNNFRLVAT